MADEQNLPAFSVMLAETEAKLQYYLQSIQNLPADKVELASDVEGEVQALVRTIKTLKFLIKHKWQPHPKQFESNNNNYSCWRNDKIVVDKNIINNKLVGDLIALGDYAARVTYMYNSAGPAIGVYLPAFGERIWLQPKHLPLPQTTTQKLEKIELADGNTAWLQPDTFKAVREVIANK